MPDDNAQISMHGRSQEVRLPKAFRLPGKEVRVSRDCDKIILEPFDAKLDVEAWFAKLDALRARSGEFLPEGRPQCQRTKSTNHTERALLHSATHHLQIPAN